MNLSQSGVFFGSDSPLREGETVEILLKMPEEITDEPPTEWRCAGHVVRVERPSATSGAMGVGVQFDCLRGITNAAITNDRTSPAIWWL